MVQQEGENLNERKSLTNIRQFLIDIPTTRDEIMINQRLNEKRKFTESLFQVNAMPKFFRK